MDAQPSSPQGQLRKDKKIFVRGADTIIRISPTAVILQTTREEGITFPEDMDEIVESNVTDVGNERPNEVAAETDEVEQENSAGKEGEEGKKATPSNIQADEIVSEEKLRELSLHLGKEWRTLALMHLGISNTNVDNIVQTTSDLRESIFQMLCLWRSKEGSNATVENLVEKLKVVVQDKSKWEFLLSPKEEAASTEDVSNDVVSPSLKNPDVEVTEESLEWIAETVANSHFYDRKDTFIRKMIGYAKQSEIVENLGRTDRTTRIFKFLKQGWLDVAPSRKRSDLAAKLGQFSKSLEDQFIRYCNDEDQSQQPFASGVNKGVFEQFGVTFKGSESLFPPLNEIPSLLLEDLEEPIHPTTAEAGGSGQLSDNPQNANLENREPIIGADKSTDDQTMEDIERVSAVFTGFAEDKKDQFTSLGASMGELLQKILTLDHENKRLKTLIKQYQDQNPSAVTVTQESKQDSSQKEKSDSSCQTKDQNNDAAAQRKNYLKVKHHLQEALDANREWERFSRNQRDEYEAKLSEAKAAIKALKEKATMAEASSSDASRQLDSILNATETQASQIEAENVVLREENKQLQEKLQRMTEEKKKVEKLSKDLLKGKTGVESNLVPPGRDKEERRTSRSAEVPRQTAAEYDRFGEERNFGRKDSYEDLMARVKTQARPPPNVFEGHDRQKTSRPENVKGSTKPSKKMSSTADDILFLKEQVVQYEQDFQRERQDREKAASELESLRRELEETKMLLAIQRDEFPAPRAHKAKSSEREKEGRRQEFFRYMGPDEVARIRSQPRGYKHHDGYHRSEFK